MFPLMFFPRLLIFAFFYSFCHFSNPVKPYFFFIFCSFCRISIVLPPEIKPKKTKNGGANPPRKQGKNKMDWPLKNTDKSAFIFPFIPWKEGFGHGEQLICSNAGSGCNDTEYSTMEQEIDWVGAVWFNGNIEDEIVCACYFCAWYDAHAEITDDFLFFLY